MKKAWLSGRHLADGRYRCYVHAQQWLGYFSWWWVSLGIETTCNNASLIPRLPLYCSSVCIQYTQKQKSSKKWGRPGLIHNVNDVRWTWSGGGAQPQKQRTGSAVWCALLQFWTSDVSMVETSCLDRLENSLSSLVCTYLNIVPSPPIYIHLMSSKVTNEPRPSLFFATLPLPCIMLNTNRRTKNRGGPGMTLHHCPVRGDSEFLIAWFGATTVVKMLTTLTPHPCCLTLLLLPSGADEPLCCPWCGTATAG